MTVTLRVVDIETAGMDPPAPLIEIGYTDVLFSPETGAVTVGAPQATLYGLAGAEMPADNRAVHHINPADLMLRPPCVPQDITMLAGGYEDDPPLALVAHNASFEQKWLTADLVGPIHWIDTFKVALRVWQDAPAHNNQTLRYWLGLDLPDELAMPPHRAGPDSYVTAHILAKMLETETVRDLVKWTMMPRFYRVCPLGKHRGQAWSEIPGDYMQWLIRTPDMEDDLKAAAREELERRRNHG